MSIGDVPFVVELNKSPTTAIIGKNGTGKSSISDAIVFALFGKSFRGLNKGDMINTTNKRGCEVKLFMKKDLKSLVVTRGIKPDTFTIEVDGAMLPETNAKTFQPTLEAIIGFDFNSFIRTSVLGYANFIPFMGMTAAARREFVETALSLGVFTELNKVVKPQLVKINAEFSETNKQISIKTAVLEEKKESNKKRSKDNESVIAGLKEMAKVAHKELEDLTLLKSQAEKAKEDNEPTYEKAERVLTKINDGLSKLDDKARNIKFQLAANKKQLDFYQSNSVCPTCKTELTEDHLEQHVKELVSSTDELTKKLVTISSHIDQGNKAKSDVMEIIENHAKLYQEVDAISKKVIEKQLELRRIKTTFGDVSATSAPEPLDSFEKELVELSDQLESLSIKQEEYQIAIDLLKDTGIKASIIEQYLPFLNKTINEYLDVIGIGINVSFDETFEETLVGRYADEFTYTSLSQGERARLNLAILFAWQDVIRIASGVQSSLIIFDEVGSDALDSDGIDAFFNIIEMSCRDQNVFMISHNSYVQEKCHSQIKLQKINGFTKIV